MPGLASEVPLRFPGGVCQPVYRGDHGGDGVGHVMEVDAVKFVTRLVVILVQAKAGDGLGDDALLCEGVVVGAAKEMLSLVRVVDQVSAVLCQLGTKVGAVEACEPKRSSRHGGVGTSDHPEFEVGHDAGQRHRRMREEGAVAEAAELLRSEECKDDGAARTAPRGEDVSESEDCGGSRGVVVCAVVDAVS